MEELLPQYRCFKIVGALRIREVADSGTDSTTDENPIVTISFEDPKWTPKTINLRGKPTPEAGWYYVVYDNGYSSFSPARAFEEGYMMLSLIPEAPIDFVGKVRHAINYHSKENGSNTPDFILAAYLDDCLTAYNRAVEARAQWYNPASDQAHVDPPAAAPTSK